MLYVKPDLNSDVLPTDGWQRVDSTSLKPVSAAAYFFARMLQDSLQMPVGFISSSWGGTRIEEWIPDGKTPGRRPMYEHLIRPLIGYILRGFLWYQGEANLLDLGETDVYTAKQEQLVNVWRKLWNDDDLPFYYVQISPYLYSIRRDFFTGEELLQFKHECTPLLDEIYELYDSFLISNEYLDNLGLKEFIRQRKFLNHIQSQNNQLHK